MTFQPYKPTGAPSATQQAAAHDADINVIAQRFLKTGVLPVSNQVPQYGDLTALPTLEAALLHQARTNEAYAALPEQVRKETGGNPNNLVGWLRDPRNRDTAIKLGLLTVTPPPPPTLESTVSKLTDTISKLSSSSSTSTSPKP